MMHDFCLAHIAFYITYILFTRTFGTEKNTYIVRVLILNKWVNRAY